MLQPSQIDWVILAGGRATRMGGQDKGLIHLNNEPMISHILHKLSPQAQNIFINANRNQKAYEKYAPVVSDQNQDFDGPLAGIQSGLRHAGKSQWVGFIPCDSPNIPDDLAERFCNAYQEDAEILVAHDGNYWQPVFTLFRRDVLEKLDHFLAQGQRKIIDLYRDAKTYRVDFSDALETFINLNTPKELKDFAEIMRSEQRQLNQDQSFQDALAQCPIPVLGFAAYSGTGKTTLLEKLLPKLTQAGLNIGLFKHAHHAFDVDKPGKDSYRLRKAGASQMMIASRNRHVLMTETPEAEAPFIDLLSHFDHSKLDFILVEGCKNLNFPKIELHRQALEKPWLYPFDPNIIAICCDDTNLPIETDLDTIALDDVDQIALFVKNWVSKQQQTKQGLPSNMNMQPLSSKASKTMPASCDMLSPAFLSVEEGREKILAALTIKNNPHLINLEDAYQHILAEDIYSPVNVPAYTNSAMDGFAVRSQDFKNIEEPSLTFECIETVLAGQLSKQKLGYMQTMKIMTGAPMPDGADTVIMREQAIQTSDTVTFSPQILPFKAGQHVRQAGEDLQFNGLVFPKGTRLLSPEMGMLASLGLNQLKAYSKLKVAIFSTGNEVQAPGAPLKSASIYDANRFSLMGQLTRLGCEIIDLGIIEDTPQAIESALSQASKEADLILSSGGVSVGDADFIKDALNKLGEINFWRINMRPGRPLAFGHLQQVPFFGLPGNPVATLIAFLCFVEPAIRQLQGEKNWQPAYVNAIASENLRSRVGRTEFSRGFYQINTQGQIEVSSTGSQGSGILRSMHEANCIIEIAPHVEQVKAGESVRIIPLQGRL